MDEAQARSIIAEMSRYIAIQEDNSLDCLDPYISWDARKEGEEIDGITIDATFSFGQQKAITWWMENMKRPTDE